MSLLKKWRNFSTNIKRKRELIFRSTSMAQAEGCSVHSLLQASNSGLKFLASKVSIRIPPQTHLSHRSSGHKYGLVYAGLGWIIFRNEEQLPKYLKFELHYLGGMSSTLVSDERNRRDVHAQLFPSRKPSHCTILQLHPSRIERLQSHCASRSRERASSLQRIGSNWMHNPIPLNLLT